MGPLEAAPAKPRSHRDGRYPRTNVWGQRFWASSLIALPPPTRTLHWTLPSLLIHDKTAFMTQWAVKIQTSPLTMFAWNEAGDFPDSWPCEDVPGSAPIP